MPLLVITGGPASGKTTIAERIREYFLGRNYQNVEIISDECDRSFSRNLYVIPRNERQQREFLRSEVQRHLSKKCLVICDSLNYLKGFRYELFCIAKLVNTTYAVVFCNANEETSVWLNSQKPLIARYDEGVIKDLYMRLEFPEVKNRWDFPLFEVRIGLGECVDKNAEIDMTMEGECLTPKLGKELPVNLSTLSTPLLTHDFMQTLEQVTKEVTQFVFQQQSGAVVGDAFVVPYCSTKDERAIFKRQRSLPELSRLRRQFVTYAKKHPVQEKSKIASLFVNFLNSNS